MALLAAAPAEALSAATVPDAGTALHPLVTEQVLVLAIADTRNFAIRRLRRSLGPQAGELCALLGVAEQITALVAVVDQATEVLRALRGDHEARGFFSAVQTRLAYANPAWRQLPHLPEALRRQPVRVTLV